MKKKKWYRSFSLVDDKYIEESNPNNVKKRNYKRGLAILVAACASLAIIAGNLWLFLPF